MLVGNPLSECNWALWTMLHQLAGFDGMQGQISFRGNDGIGFLNLGGNTCTSSS
jgi:hypothetical protein